MRPTVAWLTAWVLWLVPWTVFAVEPVPVPASGPDAVRSHPGAADATVFVTRVDGPIGPATADHLHRALQWAAGRNAALFVLELDTPGGLDASMRSIIKDILASPVPVATFVAPNGARAASAGTYILYASHVAAMAPATNLGAATPVAIGMPGTGTPPASPAPARPAPFASGAASGASAAQEPAAPGHAGDPMTAKRLSDASAYLRSLAQLRGRNAQWAERAVRESVSLSAREALSENVIDLIATDVPDLLRQLDGRELALAGGTLRLATRGAQTIAFDADWRTRLLSVITDPSLALVLMMIGIYGLLFEFANPGLVLPGVLGGISLLLGLFALQMLPINYAGLALIALGVAFLIAEAFLPSFGALGLGGIVAFAIGAVILIDSDVPGFGISWPLIAGLAATSAAFILIVAGAAAKARSRPIVDIVSGAPGLVGAHGELVEFGPSGEGWALVRGVHWKVRGAATLRPGQRVRVREALNDSTLAVAADDDPPTRGA